MVLVPFKSCAQQNICFQILRQSQVRFQPTTGPDLFSSLVPSSFQRCMRKTRKPGKTYHVSDVTDGTDLFNSSQVGPTHYVTQMVSFTIKKLRGALV